jgi:inhibitor of KinA
LTRNYKIYPLGDAAACIDLGNVIDEETNRKIISIRDWLHMNSFEGLKDIIIAYSSISVYYDPGAVKQKYHFGNTAFDFVSKRLEDAYLQSASNAEEPNEPVRIPLCYSDDFAVDIGFVSKEKNISREEIIHLHSARLYRVYMIGFLPGFSYLGKIDERLVIPRKPQPVTVLPGSVGIAGAQTGIYPMACPGGWQIIGRTPLKLFDANAPVPILLNVGDYVQFYEISKDEFENYLPVQKSKMEE